MDGGYSNDYGLDKAISKGRMQNLLNNVMGKTGKNIEKVLDVPDPVTNSSMIAVISRVAGVEVDTYDAQI